MSPSQVRFIKINRRQFLKATGAASAALGSVGLGFFGYEAGRDPESYTGWETREGAQGIRNSFLLAVSDCESLSRLSHLTIVWNYKSKLKKMSMRLENARMCP